MTSPAESGVDAVFRRTLDHVAAPVRLSVPGAGVVYANRSWCQLTGSRPDDNTGDGWLRFVHEEDRLVAGAPGVADEPREYRVLGPDGQAVMVTERSSVATDDSSGAVTGVVHTVMPRSPAADHGQSMSRWAHELRGPLNAILGWSDLLGSGDNAAEVVQRGLKAIANNARQQALIIKRMTE